MIPKSGATLLIASHGNDLPDILLTFLASDRDILFVANIAAADSPAVRWTYAGLGVIPVSRVRDARALKARGEDASALNANAFVRVVDALKQGHVVAIFPEGVVPDFPRLGALRNGAAKMALQAIENGVTSLTMVPIGYQYECAHEPRSGVLGVVGKPVAVEHWKPENPVKRVTEFTDFMCDALGAVTRNARTQHDAQILASISAAAGATLSSANESPIAASHTVQRTLSQLSAADEIFVADSMAPAAIHLRAEIEAFGAAALTLSHAAAKFGANTWSARDIADVLRAAGDDAVSPSRASLLLVVLLSPVAALGWIWHVIPIWISHALALRIAPRKQEQASRVLLPGLYIVEFWYVAVPILLLVLGASRWLVLLLFILQPRLGDFALKWRDHLRTWRLARRVRSVRAAEREAIRSLGVGLRTSWLLLKQSVATRL